MMEDIFNRKAQAETMQLAVWVVCPLLIWWLFSSAYSSPTSYTAVWISIGLCIMLFWYNYIHIRSLDAVEVRTFEKYLFPIVLLLVVTISIVYLINDEKSSLFAFVQTYFKDPVRTSLVLSIFLSVTSITFFKYLQTKKLLVKSKIAALKSLQEDIEQRLYSVTQEIINPDSLKEEVNVIEGRLDDIDKSLRAIAMVLTQGEIEKKLSQTQEKVLEVIIPILTSLISLFLSIKN